MPAGSASSFAAVGESAGELAGSTSFFAEAGAAEDRARMAPHFHPVIPHPVIPSAARNRAAKAAGSLTTLKPRIDPAIISLSFRAQRGISP
jgi:hypothetical protein